MFLRGKSFYVRQFLNGKDRWLTLGRDYTAAKEKLRLLRLGETPSLRITVAAAAQRWLAIYIENSRTPRQRSIARYRVSKYLEPQLGGRQLSAVKADDLRAYRIWLEEQGLAPQTVRGVLSDARCMYSWAVESGLVDKSPVPRKLLPRLQEQLPDRLTDEEVEALLAIPEPHAFAIRLGLGTGLRWAELCRAQASDVEQGALVISRTKTGKVRRVPLAPQLLAEVRTRIGRLVPFDGEQPSAFSKTVRRLGGVSRFHTHQMRHTFACRWLEVGGSLPALQQILGHSSVAMTQRYGRLSDQAVREQAERVWAG
jgi:integrase